MIQSHGLNWSLPFQEHVPHEQDRYWVQNIARQLPFLADFLPADLLIHVPTEGEHFVTVAEAKPTVRQSFYRRAQVGHVFTPEHTSAIWQAYHSGQLAEGAMGKVVNGQPMNQVAYPLHGVAGIAAILVVERNLYEELKHAESKRQLYRTAITRLVETLISKARLSSLALPPIAPGDALLLMNDRGTIMHASTVALNLARRLGMPEQIEGLNWSDTFLKDHDYRPVHTNPIFNESELVTPFLTVAVRTIPLQPSDYAVDHVKVLHDITELKQKDRELKIKSTLVKEVHHRVKNNLQTVAGLLRLQSRRSENIEVKAILQESIARIASIALVHEYLSQGDVGVVNVKELVQNLISSTLQGLLDPSQRITMTLDCPAPVTLPSAQATSCALVVNELLQNTIKHAFSGRTSGHVQVVLQELDEGVLFTLEDDGVGLPEDFSPLRNGNLGWQIIQTLVRDDLHGELEIAKASGTRVRLLIPYPTPGTPIREA
ncbi:MAG: histidine kinase N-terminal domain-containing protein [Candidatus Sericytochromatia bacterium]|nr:histidine kinase N-terminal domain-containing protein [Candidatus Sericytochromatia bacterium]